MFRWVAGLPVLPRRDLAAHRRRTISRCQRRTVSGVTSRCSPWRRAFGITASRVARSARDEILGTHNTNECRSSRGVHAPPSRAAPVIFWNSFRTCQRSSGVPPSRQNTRSCSCHASPAASRSAALASAMPAGRLGRPGGQFQHAAALAGLGVTLDPYGPIDGHRAGLRSTSSHVIARASSVRMPSSRDKTT